ncbi:hypothetical protein MKW98_020807 [Papaver atlanticum]|uniref:Protein kinase domain-containing protein n=1 Tax=Papaver atlanticum TaxID=357466 RepID=A0AAD4TIH8_9MAGN|nr:hypothetical protein MKW98_020807 [Papaver atlanticum]
MPILGRKPVPEQEELTQKSFSLSIKDDGSVTNTKAKGKKITAAEDIRRENFSYKQIKAATKDFKPANKIGEGGFGSGKLPDGREIAVKVISPNSTQGEKEFLSEINTVSSHPNIVELFGHCVARDNKGYIAPEYLKHGYLTEKADVYCFGVVVLELMSGMSWRGYLNRSQNLLEIAKDLKMKQSLISLLDQDLTNISENEATMVLDLAVLCTSDSPKARPNMSDVNVTNTLAVQLESDDLTGVTSDEMALNDFSVNYLEIVTNPGNAPTTSANEVTMISESCELISVAKDDKSGDDKDGAGFQSSGHFSLMEVTNTKSTAVVWDYNAAAKDLKREVGEDEIPIRSSHVASNSTKLHSHVKASVGDGADDSKSSVICTNIPTSDTLVSNAKVSSTSSTLNDITEMGDEDELEYIKPHFEEGKYHIECSNEEFKVGCNKWKNSLVGYFLSEDGTFNVDKEVVAEVVLRQTMVNVSVFSIRNEHYLFQFSCVEDKTKVLESSSLLHVEGNPLLLIKWDWKLTFDKAETMKCIPIWVRIYNLPLFLWNPSCLSKVVSAFGIPICADQKTKKKHRLDYARVYMKVDANKPLLDSFLISVKGIDYLLNLEYDWKPLRCTNCFTFGHTELKCKLKIKVKQD